MAEYDHKIAVREGGDLVACVAADGDIEAAARAADADAIEKGLVTFYNVRLVGDPLDHDAWTEANEYLAYNSIGKEPLPDGKLYALARMTWLDRPDEDAPAQTAPG